MKRKESEHQCWYLSCCCPESGLRDRIRDVAVAVVEGLMFGMQKEAEKRVVEVGVVERESKTVLIQRWVVGRLVVKEREKDNGA